jgi:hypothetical protein
MKTIDEIIRSNRDFFDEAEPSSGHLERFSKKMEARFGTGTAKRSIVPYLLKAAVVTLLVTLSSLWTWDNFINPGRHKMALGDVSPEFREVENYYLHQVNLMESELGSLTLPNDEAHTRMLKKEMKSMDSVYVQLQKDLKANPNDERIINAMIEMYQTKVEVMAYILNQLKELRNENQNRTENEKVSI